MIAHGAGGYEVRIEVGAEIYTATFATRPEAERMDREKWREMTQLLMKRGGEQKSAPGRIDPQTEMDEPTETPESPLSAALEYAATALRVFPVHSIGRDGKCSCGKTCDSPGKHPRTKHGLNDATTDEKQVRRWWDKWPDSNIGVATGDSFFTLDVDGAGGKDSLGSLENEHGKLPLSWEHRTGNGRQIHFTFSRESNIRNSTRKIGPGLDIRGQGGYVIFPPSRHYTGRNYQWIRSPKQTPLADPPEWLIKSITDLAKSAPNEPIDCEAHPDLALTLDGVPKGQRDDMINKYVWSRLGKGMSVDEVKTLVVEAASVAFLK